MKTWLLPAEQFLYTPGLNWDLLCGEPIFFFFFLQCHEAAANFNEILQLQT